MASGSGPAVTRSSGSSSSDDGSTKVTTGGGGGANRVVTAGETMVLVVPSAPGRLRHATNLSLSIGGAESNVAIGLARLGIPASWVSALGDDELGELVLNRLRAEGVDTTAVRRVRDRPTGLYLREEVAGSTRVYYYRRGSAASTLSPGEFEPAVLEGADFLHLTGITAALSPEGADWRPVPESDPNLAVPEAISPQDPDYFWLKRFDPATGLS